MKARVHVTLKNGVLDPQGKAIGHSLNRLGFPEVGDVRQGKFIELELAETDKEKAKARLEDDRAAWVQNHGAARGGGDAHTARRDRHGCRRAALGGPLLRAA